MGEAHIPAEQPPEGAPARLPSPHGHPGRAGHPAGSSPEGAPPPVGLIGRLRERSTFELLQRQGRRSRRHPVSVSWLDSDTLRPPQVAYAVSRKAGGAVVRNRVRRRLRAVMADLAPALRPGAYLVGGAKPAASMPYGELVGVVKEALSAVGAVRDGAAAGTRR